MVIFEDPWYSHLFPIFCSGNYIWLKYFPHQIQTYNVLSYYLLKRVPVVVVVAARLLTKCQKFHRGRKEAACDSTPDVLAMCSVSYVSPATVLRIQRQPWDDHASAVLPSHGRLTGSPGGSTWKFVRSLICLSAALWSPKIVRLSQQKWSKWSAIRLHDFVRKSYCSPTKPSDFCFKIHVYYVIYIRLNIYSTVRQPIQCWKIHEMQVLITKL